ncbi:hypothetical protein, partial [Micromonospora orduensis]|uniref:hypothetical protein n=1 Tax=Micromonospora orduensis TaxID=1420891 RepID=UPI001ABFFF98
ARTLADRAETIAGSITDRYEQAQALTALAEAAAGAGDLDRAERIARSITDPKQQAWALTALAEAVAGAGDLDRAETIARSITKPDQQAQALIGLASRCVNQSGAPLTRDSASEGVALARLRARSLVAAALALGSWEPCLGVGTRVQLAGFATLAAERLLAN